DLRFLFVALAIVAAPFVFNYFYYGAVLPATGGAKIGQGQSGLWGGGWIFLNVSYFLPAFMGGSALAAAFLVGLSMYGLLTEIRHRIVLISLAFWLLLAMFYVGLNIPNYHWYYAPFVYLALIAA